MLCHLTKPAMGIGVKRGTQLGAIRLKVAIKIRYYMTLTGANGNPHPAAIFPIIA